MLKQLKSMFSRFKNKFKLYDEEICVGIDVEALMNDPERDKKVQNALRENEERFEATSERYHEHMEQLNIVERLKMAEKSLQEDIQGVCKQVAECKVSMKDAEEKNAQAKNRENPHIRLVTKDITQAIRVLKDYERNQDSVKKDMNILEGEKQNLLYQFTHLKRTLVFIKYFMAVLVLSTLIAGIVFSTMVIVYQKNVFFPLLTCVLILAFLLIVGFLVRRYALHEIKKNQLLQERAVKLLNKTKLKYIRNQELLDFEYAKYQVDSSEVLELRYEYYLDAKEQQKNYDSMHRSMKNLIDDLAYYLKKIHIDTTDFVVEYAEYFATAKGIERLFTKQSEERYQLQQQLQRLQKEKTLLENV